MEEPYNNIDKQFASIEENERNEELQDMMSLEQLALRTPKEDEREINPFIHGSRWRSAADNIVYLVLWIILFAAILYLLFY